MKSLIQKLAVICLLAVSVRAMADDISVGTPTYGGTGCPAGSASASVTDDGKSVSILFDEYLAQAGGDTGRSLDRKTCNLAIPVHVPNGYSVSILKVDYRGFNSLPRGAKSQFRAEYFFAGSVGPKINNTFYGPLNNDYLIQDELIASAIVWSPCGADVNLRVNSSITLQNNTRTEALTTVDSADINASIVYRIQTRRCR